MKNTDFVLKTKSDEALIQRIERYEAFLSVLCGQDFTFQKEAIYEVLKYFFSDRYSNLWELAKENFEFNPKLVEKFGTTSQYKSHLQLPHQKSCSVDLATGTGKSFVIYGIAQIMLAEGLVDQVLVLCPSRTIEAGLTEKFVTLAGHKTLKDVLPHNAVFSNPRIVNATTTIKEGDICIENIHAIYKNTGSSISDSLKRKGPRTLVLNDEAHHIFTQLTTTKNNRALKEWKKFLVNPDYGFHYIANFSGTPYIGQEYFLDVLYRYSLKDAIQNRVVKSVEYLIETGDERRMKGFEEIWQNHQVNKSRYKEVKPISLIVTSDISSCIEVWAKLVSYIAKQENLTFEEARRRAIWVVSDVPSKSTARGQRAHKLLDKPERERQENLLLLAKVDDDQSPVEWIVSVAMLTEGWDVNRVFQIVPHESRAFNSKLLIAQVLGRGLRIPDIYRGRDDITVRIYNHIKFSPQIKNLVDEVLENDARVSWFPSPNRMDFNFNLHNLTYAKDIEFKQSRRRGNVFSASINFAPQDSSVEDYGIYKDVLTGQERTARYKVKTDNLDLRAASQIIWAMLAAYDTEQGTSFRLNYPKSEILQILRNNLPVGCNFISHENLNRAKSAFGKLFDMGGAVAFFKNRVDELTVASTSQMSRQSLSASSLQRDAMCFYDSGTLDSLDGDEKITMQSILENEENFKLKQVTSDQLRTPLNCLVVNFEPERKFAKLLLQNFELFDSFIKNPDRSFYGIPYSYKKGTHMKYSVFSPDFFLKKDNNIFVVEIKKDNDDSRENVAKSRDAQRHFQTINDHQVEQNYFFYFLSPEDYLSFFQAVREDRHEQFESSLTQVLKNKVH